ncbi:hypothetical protein D3C71_1503950 [compost metagenome]
MRIGKMCHRQGPQPFAPLRDRHRLCRLFAQFGDGEVLAFLPLTGHQGCLPHIAFGCLNTPDAGDAASVVLAQKHGLLDVGGGRNGKDDGVAVSACLTVGGIAGTVDAVLEQPDDPVAAPPDTDPPAGAVASPGCFFAAKAVGTGILFCMSRISFDGHSVPRLVRFHRWIFGVSRL